MSPRVKSLRNRLAAGIAAAALSAFLATNALAQELQPQKQVVITGDSVTLADIFPGVTHDAGYVLAPAPDYGRTLVLSAEDLERVSDAFGLGWTPATEHEQSAVRRNTHEINSMVAADAVQRALKSKTGQKYQVDIAQGSIEMPVPAGVPATAEAVNLSFDPARGEFTAQIQAPAGSSHPLLKQDISGRVFALASVPVLKHAMRPGDAISASDVEFIDMRQADLDAGTLTDQAKIVGWSPRSGLVAMKPLEASDLVPPLDVRKGDLVVMELRSGGMFLTVEGKALQSGAAGEQVQVENTTSNQVVTAVVKGPKTVAVAAPIGADNGT